MRIAEIYKSIQGEGFLTGTESVFVRASGCNLRCWFCDTPYTSWNPEGVDLSVEEIVNEVESLDCRHVVITGGEPMLFSELIPLCEHLHEDGKHITIETAGTLYLPLQCDLMSISPKLSNSGPSADDYPKWHLRHEHTRLQPDVIHRLIKEHDYQLKFIVDKRDDCNEIEQYLQQFPEVTNDQVLLMPQGVDIKTLDATGNWLEPYCSERGLHFCPRKQIEWFGLARGT